MSRSGRARRGVDMLPLLDVFMVVLFVFATIQEQQLDSSTQELDEAVAELAAATAQSEAQAERIAGLEVELEALEQRAGRDGERREALTEQVEAYERACGSRRLGGPLCPAAELDPDAAAMAAELAAMAGLHERLLDNIAVFELELAGRPELETGELHNPCCFRADPPKGEWRRCGEVPSDASEMSVWLDDGADGLIAGLNRTRGGKAVVLLRQSGDARYRISNDLAELLRERLPDFRVYDDGVAGSPLLCPLF